MNSIKYLLNNIWLYGVYRCVSFKTLNVEGEYLNMIIILHHLVVHVGAGRHGGVRLQVGTGEQDQVWGISWPRKILSTQHGHMRSLLLAWWPAWPQHIRTWRETWLHEDLTITMKTIMVTWGRNEQDWYKNGHTRTNIIEHMTKTMRTNFTWLGWLPR